MAPTTNLIIFQIFSEILLARAAMVNSDNEVQVLKNGGKGVAPGSPGITLTAPGRVPGSESSEDEREGQVHIFSFTPLYYFISIIQTSKYALGFNCELLFIITIFCPDRSVWGGTTRQFPRPTSRDRSGGLSSARSGRSSSGPQANK